MASFRFSRFIAFASIALVGAVLLFNVTAAQTRKPSDNERVSKDVETTTDRIRDRKQGQAINFSRRTAKDLYTEGLRETAVMVSDAPGVAEQTKVWVAEADVASLPGAETIVHVKGPLTCGRLGCELVIMGDVGGSRKVLMKTLCNTIDAPAMDMIVINQGTDSEVIWKFDGAKFVEQ